MDFKKLIVVILSTLLLFGFRVIPNMHSWDIDKTSTTNAKLFIKFDNSTSTLKNDFPSDDPLAGQLDVTIQQIVNSIIDDYNNVQGAFVVLADANDPDFASRGDSRTITVTNGAAIGLTSGGYARPTLVNGKMKGCEIVLTSAFFNSAKDLARGITHELGHCLGLNHPMDTVHAVMSYYYEGHPTIRLQVDDKMGLVYLYPVDSAAAKEQATLGLACSRAQ